MTHWIRETSSILAGLAGIAWTAGMFQLLFIVCAFYLGMGEIPVNIVLINMMIRFVIMTLLALLSHGVMKLLYRWFPKNDVLELLASRKLLWLQLIYVVALVAMIWGKNL